MVISFIQLILYVLLAVFSTISLIFIYQRDSHEDDDLLVSASVIETMFPQRTFIPRPAGAHSPVRSPDLATRRGEVPLHLRRGQRAVHED
ncbi:hypothetical protein M3Y96_00003500 [Aphelenchoides besseyi]|nr:hypothetical protein M3Y96_00003500 [Aphelenchoides besseyi]